MPHVAPDHPDTQLHVFGAVQVPPLAHTGEQTATMENRKIVLREANSFLMKSYSRVVQRVPVHVDGQVQVPGLEQVPPFEHAGVHTAKVSICFENE